jgi:excisionase family DNA binding protein
MPDQRLAYTVEEIAGFIGVSKMTVYHMVENGELPHKRIGAKSKKGQGRIIIPAVDFHKWLSKPDEPCQETVRKNAEKIVKGVAKKLRVI